MGATTAAQRVWNAVKAAARVLGGGVALWVVRQVVRYLVVRRRIARANPQLCRKQLYRGGLLGSIPAVIKNYGRLYDFKLERSQESGPTYASMVGFWRPICILSTADPENVRHILSTNFNNYIKSDTLRAILADLIGDGIFVANHGPHSGDKGRSWLLQRKTASKIFTRNVFQGHLYETFEVNGGKIAKRLDEIAGRRAIDMQTVFFKFTMDTIGSVGFGKDLNTLDEEGNAWFASAFDKAQKLSFRRAVVPLWDVFGTLIKSEADLADNIRQMDKFSFDVIEERLRDPDTPNKSDILSHFVNYFRENEGLDDMTDAERKRTVRFLRDVVMSFFIAGRDTTACTLSFTFLLLAMHPEMQERLLEEVEREMPACSDPADFRSPTLEQLKSGFPYLNGVVHESLRLFPPVPSDGKVAAEDDVLPDGTVVPAGTIVNYEVYVMGRSEEIWGPDAHQARPERWILPDGSKRTANDWSFPVFQQPSKRECLGKDLALFEAKVLTADLVRRFHFKMARPPPEPWYSPGLTLTVNGGLPMIATPRHKM